MLALFSACCLASALAAFTALRARERRLETGEAGRTDLAAWTGITDRRSLLGLAGVRERADGSLAFDPRFLDGLPAHPIGRAFDSYPGIGLCVALCLAGLGVAAEGAGPGPFPYLVATAAAYLLLGRLWSAAVWLELGTQEG